MDELFQKLSEMPWVAQTLGLVVGFNLVIMGVIKMLEVVKDKTKTEVDNKLHAFLSKVQGFLGSLIAYKK